MTSLQAIALVKRLPTPNDLLCEYTPDRQWKYLEDEKECFMGQGPALSVVSQAYGKNVARSWMAIQLQDVNKYANVGSKLDNEEIYNVATNLLAEFYDLKVTEMMRFFNLYKNGRWGHLYGAVDPIRIGTALHDFVNERNIIVARLQREIENERRENERREWEERAKGFRDFLHRNHISHEEFFKISLMEDGSFLPYEEIESENILWLLKFGYEKETPKNEMYEFIKSIYGNGNV